MGTNCVFLLCGMSTRLTVKRPKLLDSRNCVLLVLFQHRCGRGLQFPCTHTKYDHAMTMRVKLITDLFCLDYTTHLSNDKPK